MGLGLRTRVAVALVSGSFPFILGAGSAPAQGVLDANCPGPGNVIFIADGNFRVAQTFTAQRTGSLVRGEIDISKGGSPGGDWVMQIFATDASGTPVYTLLASTTPIPDATVPVGDSRLAGLFTSPASVVAGKLYAIVLTRPGASEAAVYAWNDNRCPGDRFQTFSPTGPFVASPGYDDVFAVFVKPSNAFLLGEIERNKKKGTATLTVNVPYPGELALSGNGVKTAGATRAVAVTAPGNVELLIRAKGKKKKKLNRKGKVKVKPNITYTPTGGDPSTQSKKLKLKKKR